ncbi:MAG: peptidylprolyl isomerase [Acidobacteriota bacterium]
MRIRSALALPLLLWMAGCGRSAPANVAATVNGRAITYDELTKQFQMAQLGSDATGKVSDDQLMIQRLEVLRAMIDAEIMLQRAERDGLLAVDADVERRFSEMRTPYTEEEFRKQLQDRRMTAEDLKTQLRRDLSAQNLLNKETTAKISITDKEIADFYETNKASFNRAEPQLHLAQILVTPLADQTTRNLKGDNALDDESAKKKINGLEVRLRKGEDFTELAQNYSEDAESAAAGGDLGFVPESALDQANTELRTTILALRPGQNTPVIKTNEGYRLIRLIAREPAGQRGLNDPNVQQTIRETLLTRKEQLLRSAFYEVARNEAEVVNYYAQSIVSGSVAAQSNSTPQIQAAPKSPAPPDVQGQQQK